MRIRTSRKAIYASMALAFVALVGGFAAASVQLGQHSNSYQGSQTTTVSAVTGITWNSTSLGMLGSTLTNTTCSEGHACNVTSAGATDCAGGVLGHSGCLAGDFVEQVTLNTVVDTAFPGNGTLEITVYVTTTGGTTPGIPYYYSQTSDTNAASEPIVQDFDIGSTASGPATVTSVTVIVAS